MKKPFLNENRERYYGLRVGDLVTSSWVRNGEEVCEVLKLSPMDNNRCYLKVEGFSKPIDLSGELVGSTKGYKHSEDTKQKMKGHKRQIGSKNSQYGTCWIYNLDLKKSKRIKKSELDLWLDKGWKKGAKFKWD